MVLRVRGGYLFPHLRLATLRGEDLTLRQSATLFSTLDRMDGTGMCQASKIHLSAGCPKKGLHVGNVRYGTFYYPSVAAGETASSVRLGFMLYAFFPFFFFFFFFFNLPHHALNKERSSNKSYGPSMTSSEQC